MLFKNLITYRLPRGFSPTPIDLIAALEKKALAPIGAFAMQSVGFVGTKESGGELFYNAPDYRSFLLTLGIEQKILPASVIRKELAERAAVQANDQGYPVGRRQMRELKERVTEELRAKALTRTSYVQGIIDLDGGYLFVNAASENKADLFVTALRDALGSLAVTFIETKNTPRGVLTAWLMGGSPTAPGFDFGTDLELKAADRTGATVRFKNHVINGEALSHINAGKYPTRVGLTWKERVDFILTDKGDVKRIQYLVVREKDENAEQDAAEIFASEFLLTVGELRGLTADLTQALGGYAEEAKVA